MMKKLYRSRKDRVFAGVCGGIAERYGFDSNIVRIITVILGVALSGGFLLYIILWFLIPVNTVEKTIKKNKVTDFFDDIEKQVRDFFKSKKK